MADTFRVRSGTSLGWWGAAGNGWGLEGPGEGGTEEGEVERSLCHLSRILEYFPLYLLGLCSLHSACLEPFPSARPLRHGGTPHCSGR